MPAAVIGTARTSPARNAGSIAHVCITLIPSRALTISRMASVSMTNDTRCATTPAGRRIVCIVKLSSGRAGIEEQPLGSEVLRTYERPFRERMIRRDDRGVLVFEERPHPKPIVADGLGDDRHIQLSLEQRLHRSEGAFDGERHLDRRMAAAEDVDERWQPMVAGVALRADAQDTRLTRAQPAYVFLGRTDVLEHPLRGGEHSLPRGGRDHTLPDPQEERRPQPPFNHAQLVADRRLRPVQFSRRPRHAAGGGNGDNHLEITNVEVHDRARALPPDQPPPRLRRSAEALRAKAEGGSHAIDLSTKQIHRFHENNELHCSAGRA